MKPVSLMAAASDKRLLGGVHPLRGPQLRLLEAMGSSDMLALISVGRQSGKSTGARLTALWNATCRPDLDAVLPPSDERFILIAATDQEQARLTIRGAAAMVDRSPLRSLVAEVTADQIVFKVRRDDGVRRVIIRAMPTRAAAVRGPSASLVIRDEAAHGMRDTGGPADEKRIIEALAGTLTPFGELGKQVWISTPAGEAGAFYERFKAAEAGALGSTVTLVASTPEMRPDLPAAFFASQRAQLGEDAFRQEFLAEFVAGGSSFFDLRDVQWEPGPVPPEAGVRWLAAFDPAFSRDSFGCALIAESVVEPGVLVTGELAAIDPGKQRLLSFESRRRREDRTLARVAEILEPYRPGTIVTDQHAPDQIRSYFGRLGYNVRVVNLTGELQTRCFVALRARLLDGSLRCWAHGTLVEEMRRVRARDSERIELPRFAASHGDLVSAMALGCFQFRDTGDAGFSGEVKVGFSNIMSGDGADTVAWFESRRARGRRDPDAPRRRGNVPPPWLAWWPGRESSEYEILKMGCDPSIHARRPWLGHVNEFVDREGARSAAAWLWDELCEQLIEGGTDPRRASEIALRCVKLVGRLLDGQEQHEAAAALDVSPRTAKSDARHVRHLIEVGVLDEPYVGPLPRVPRYHGDRLVESGSLRRSRQIAPQEVGALILNIDGTF